MKEREQHLLKVFKEKKNLKNEEAKVKQVILEDKIEKVKWNN